MTPDTESLKRKLKTARHVIDEALEMLEACEPKDAGTATTQDTGSDGPGPKHN